MGEPFAEPRTDGWPASYGGNVNCFGIPDTYRGWSVEQGPDDCFYAFGPEYDGPGSFHTVQGCSTWEELAEEIDAKIAEWNEANGQFGVAA